VITPRGFASLPTQEAQKSFSGFIPTNKQTNKQTNKHVEKLTKNNGKFIDKMHSMGLTLRSSPRKTFACSLPVSRHISFCPKCSLLFQWQQASPTSNVGSETANPVVSRPGRLRTSEIPKPLSVSLVITPPRHHLPALPSDIGELGQNLYNFGRGN